MLSLCVAHRELDLLALGGARELDPARQQDRLAEADVDARRRRAGGSRAPPGSAPWSTSRARSPAGSRAASRSARACGSGCGRRRRRRSGGRGRRRGATRRSAGELVGARPLGRARPLCAAGSPSPPPRRSIVLTSSQTFSAPTHASVTRREGAAARVRLELGRADAQLQLLAEPDPPVLDDPVLDVDEADRAEGEAAVGHHRHVQREGEDVRVGGGQVVAQREAADPGVGGDRVRRRPAPRPGSSSSSGISLPPPGMKGSSEAPGIIGAAARA